MCVLADGDVGQQLPRRPTKGFKVLRISARVTSISDAEPVRSLADIKGLKIRVIENGALVEGFQRLAPPTPLPYRRSTRRWGPWTARRMTCSVETLKLYVKFLTYSKLMNRDR